MRWYHYIAWFIGGAALTNVVPHFTNGISGRMFPTPFATPPGPVGVSPPVVNVLWALFNLLVGYVLVCRVGKFDLRNNRCAAALFLGVLVMAVNLAPHLRRPSPLAGCACRPSLRAPRVAVLALSF